MTMAVSSLLPSPSAPAPPPWRRRRPLLLVAAPPSALRLRPAPASLATGIQPLPGKSRARATFTVALSRGGGEAADRVQAPDWGALTRRLVLGALLGGAALGCGAALAAEDSIKASGFGLRMAAELRKLEWPDEAVVFTLATLPVLELRGAIPAGYWMRPTPSASPSYSWSQPYRSRIRPLGEVLPEPDVPGRHRVNTVESLLFRDGGFDAGPMMVMYGDGDGTVNLASLVGPIKAWSDSPAEKLL